MNTQRFMVEIVTSEKITTDEDINEIAQNIANAIVYEASEFNILPDGCDSVAQIVYVKGWYSDKQIIEHIN